MKFVRTIVVFDRGGLLDSEQWAAIHKTYVKALRGIVHPPGNDKFVIRKKTRKRSISGASSNQWMRNGVMPIKDQFLANLKNAGWHVEKPAGLDIGSTALQKAHERTDVSLKEYPGKREYQLDDQDWEEVLISH